MNDTNLPDTFVERVKALEINYDIFRREYDNFQQDYKRIKQETKRSRLFWHFLDNLPISPGVTLSILTAFTFFIALIAEIIIRVTVVDDWIHKFVK
ncbi:MAG: hypothetical protein RLZZ338_1767 [Cyanobacteriota bacterium]|jgi:hypothetical protein